MTSLKTTVEFISCQTKISSLQQLYQLMHATVGIRKPLVSSILANQTAQKDLVGILQRCLELLIAIPKSDQGHELALDSDRAVTVDLSYEIQELEKDLLYLTEGEQALLSQMARNSPSFSEQVSECTEKLRTVKFRNFISDRDGTVNNYCSRYLTSTQSVYNAVFLTRFAQKSVENAVILTSAPLANGGLVDISTTAADAFIFAGSKGREYVDSSGTRGSFPIPPEQATILEKLNKRIASLVEQSQYEKFSLIGSGFQQKFGQSTIARQDINESVQPKESLAFMKTIESIVDDLDPEKSFFRIEDTGKDIEILLTIKDDSAEGGLKDFDKGDGVLFLDKSLSMNVGVGPNLVCGDTGSDVPMFTACLAACPETHAVFVTTSEELKARLESASPTNVIVVNQPDTLVASLNQLSK